MLQLSATNCQAQLFGSSRQLGQPIGRPQGQTGRGGQPVGRTQQSTEGVGQVQGNERFLRNNRGRAAFVGTDRLDRRGFVGSQQGTTNGPVVPSTTGVRPSVDRSRQINQPLPRVAKNAAYYPKLELGSGFAGTIQGVRFPNDLQEELENPDYFSSENRYEVLVVGRQAILRGVVADARQRDLAELLVSFEPGISVVRNELQFPSQDTSIPPRPTVDPTPQVNDLPPPMPARPPAAVETTAPNSR